MTPSLTLQWTARGVGALLIVLNSLHLTYGFSRLRHALVEAQVVPRFGEPLAIAWVYLGIINLTLGAILLWISADLAAGSPGAWKAAVGIGAGLVLVGLASYLATGKHPGLLFFAVFGLALLVPLFLFRSHFVDIEVDHEH